MSRMTIACVALFFPALATADELPPGALVRLGTTRWRHGSYTSYLAFSADGRELGSFVGNGIPPTGFHIWDVATGERVRIRGGDVGVNNQPTRLNNGRTVWHDFAYFSMSPRPEAHDYGAGADFATSALGRRWKLAGTDLHPLGLRNPHLIAPLAATGGDLYACAALSPDGRHLACGRRGATASAGGIDIWDLTDEPLAEPLRSPRRFANHPGDCDMLRYSPDGRTLISMSVTKLLDFMPRGFQVIAWNTLTGRERRRFNIDAPLSHGVTQCQHGMFRHYSSVAVSDRHLAVYAEDANDVILVWDLFANREVRIAAGHKRATPYDSEGVNTLAFAPDGTLISGGWDGSIKFWDPATGRELRRIDAAFVGRVYELAVSPDGKRLAAAGEPGLIRVWELPILKELSAGPGLAARITSSALTPEARIVVTACADNTLRFWDVAAGRERALVNLPRTDNRLPQVAIAPDGRTVLVAAGGRLLAWDAVSGRECRAPALPARTACHALDFSADGRTLLVLGTGAVRLIDWPSGTVRRTLTLSDEFWSGSRRRPLSAALSPDGRWLALISCSFSEEKLDCGMIYQDCGDAELELWDVARGEPTGLRVAGNRNRFAAAFTRDGELLFFGGGTLQRRGGPDADLEHGFHYIDPLTGRVRRSVTDAPSVPWEIRPAPTLFRLSRDGRTLFVGENLYEVATGGKRRGLAGHGGDVMNLAVTPDGQRLITAGTDLTALLWDVSLAAAAPPGPPPSAARRARLWDQLVLDDSAAAYRAMAELAAHPTLAVETIRSNLKPVPLAPDAAVMERWLRDLADARFSVRDGARRELDRAGEAAAVYLRSRRSAVTAPEVCKRLDALLASYEPGVLTPARLREERALELLEQLNTPESRAALAELARGAPGAHLTRQAGDSLRRAQAALR